MLTCLLDEETVKGSHHETAARVAELAARLSLANAAAFTFQHMPMPSNPPAAGNATGVSHPQQVAEALLSSMHNQAATAPGSEYGYFLAPAAPVVTSTVAVVPVDGGTSLRMSPISPATTHDNGGVAMWDPNRRADDAEAIERQRNGEIEQSGGGGIPVVNLPRKSGRRVDTVAKTLAAIKASNSLTPRSDTAAASYSTLPLTPTGQPPPSPSNHVKLPDIQTLAQRLPSFHQTALDIKPSLPAVPTDDAGTGEPWQTAPTGKPSPQPPDLEISVDATAGIEVGTGGKKKFQCMFCGIYLSTKCYLKNHINAVHTRSRVYQCDLCAHYFYSAGAARIHKLRNHWHDAKKHRCSECSETFLLPIELRKHVQKKHCGTSSYQMMIDSSKLEPGEVLPAVSATNTSMLGGGTSSAADATAPVSSVE